MPRFKSIVSRLVCLHVIAVVMTGVATPATLAWFLNAETVSLQERAMRDQAEVLATRLAERPDGSLQLNLTQDMQALYSGAYARYFFAIVDRDGRVLFSSQRDGSAVFSPEHGSLISTSVQSRPGKRISGTSIEHAVADRTVYLQVGEDLAHRDVITDDLARDFLRSVGWITVPILLLLLGIDIVIFRRALNPLIEASRAAGLITPSSTGIRLPTEALPSEMGPLVTAVNGALDRLEDGLRVQRDFAADAAHELRTPLAILRARLESLEVSDARRHLERDVRIMERIVAQLLDMAELEALVGSADAIAELVETSRTVAEDLGPIALKEGKTISLSGETTPVWVRGDAEMIGRAVRNIAENAIKHTQVGSEVEFFVERVGAVSVLDRGAGIEDDEREHLFQRFWRRDRSKNNGAGLGLAIVRRIVEINSGTISFANRPKGGACFRLAFQSAEPPKAAARHCQSDLTF